MSTSYDTVIFETDENGIATITINRPDKLNALNEQVLNDLASAILEVEQDEQVKGVIVTGAGEKAFVAGADIQTINALDEEAGKSFSSKGQQVFQAIEDLRKPVIAAVNGYALGGGCELAMACHLRIASEDAQFGLPETSLGLVPGYGGTQRLAQLAGRAKALEMIMTAQPVKADEANDIGLINAVDPNPLLEAENMLKTINKNGPLAVQTALSLLYQSNGADGFEQEAEAFGSLCTTDDMEEGTSAFLEKRKPAFEGK